MNIRTKRINIGILFDRMILINGKEMDWHRGITLEEIYGQLGYTISSPPVLVKIDGKVIKRDDRNSLVIEDGAEIEIKSVLRGG